MRVTGIIAEYNPFHSGHQYHIEQARALSGAEFCVVAMSGDFVQRGEPAVYSKYLRARAALTCGADLVLEIPGLFAAGSAEDFASCGVALLTGLGAVDTLCFGSECGSMEILMDAARSLVREPAEYAELLSRGVKEGLTWPQARNRALERLGTMDEKSLDALKSPNNLLGIEYCRAIIRQNSPLKPFTVLRRGNGYHDGALNGSQASASALRWALAGDPDGIRGADFKRHMPPEAVHVFEGTGPLFARDCSTLLNFALAACVRQGIDLAGFEGMNRDMTRRLSRMLLTHADWEGRVRQLKTRQYTYTRVNRALCHILLGITSEQTAAGRAAGYAPYARVLGFKRSAAPLLNEIKQKGAVPLITKTADAGKILSGTAMSMLEQDFYGSHLWQTVYLGKYGTALKNEFNQGLVII